MSGDLSWCILRARLLRFHILKRETALTGINLRRCCKLDLLIGYMTYQMRPIGVVTTDMTVIARLSMTSPVCEHRCHVVLLSVLSYAKFPARLQTHLCAVGANSTNPKARGFTFKYYLLTIQFYWLFPMLLQLYKSLESQASFSREGPYPPLPPLSPPPTVR